MSDPQAFTPNPSDDSPQPALFQPAPEQHGILMGRFGLRAGWGILLQIVFFAALLACAHFVTLAARGKLHQASHTTNQTTAAQAQAAAPPAKTDQDNQPLTAGSESINTAVPFAALVLATFLVSRIERRRFGVYGLGENRLRDLLPGAFWGLALLSILVGLLRSAHLLVFDARLLNGGAIVLYALKWLLVFLLVGLLEEYMMRGYLQYTLTRGFFGLGERVSPSQPQAVAFWIAAFFMSIVFASLHLLNPGENHIGIVMVFMAGIVFSYALWHTGSLWWGIGFHMAWDWAQTFLYGVPDSGGLGAGRLFQTHAIGNPLLSGGSDGPEGSLLVIPILLLTLLAIRFSPRGTQPSLYPQPAALPANDRLAHRDPTAIAQ